MKKIYTIFSIITIYFFLSTSAYAYIDPGSGSIILQAIIAAFVGASTTIAIYWQKIKLFFSKIFKKKNNEKK
jgi:hypothetical protein